MGKIIHHKFFNNFQQRFAGQLNSNFGNKGKHCININYILGDVRTTFSLVVGLWQNILRSPLLYNCTAIFSPVGVHGTNIVDIWLHRICFKHVSKLLVTQLSAGLDIAVTLKMNLTTQLMVDRLGLTPAPAD